jgi:biopolymer transport protein ExbB
MWYRIYSYLAEGGIVMYPILGVSLMVWYLGLHKLIEILIFRHERKRFHTIAIDAIGRGVAIDFVGHGAFEELAESVNLRATPGHNYFEQCYRNFLIDVIPSLEKRLTTMSAWVTTAPLLGLLGTVTGMIETFRTIMLFGVGNPTLTAEGISIALLTTQAGLTVAFPALLLHNALYNAKEKTVAALMVDGEEYCSLIQESTQQTAKD